MVLIELNGMGASEHAYVLYTYVWALHLEIVVTVIQLKNMRMLIL